MSPVIGIVMPENIAALGSKIAVTNLKIEISLTINMTVINKIWNGHVALKNIGELVRGNVEKYHITKGSAQHLHKWSVMELCVSVQNKTATTVQFFQGDQHSIIAHRNQWLPVIRHYGLRSDSTHAFIC